MKFKKYLNESENIIMSKEFVKNVENFIFKNDKKYISSISKYKNKIPIMFRTSRNLYRGMILSNKTVNIIENNKKEFTLNDYSSWTDNIKIAEKIINDEKRKLNNENNGIVFRKKFSSTEIILNIQQYLFFLDGMGKLDEYSFDESTKEMGLKEAETIIDKGVVLIKKNLIKKIIGK